MGKVGESQTLKPQIVVRPVAPLQPWTKAPHGIRLTMTAHRKSRFQGGPISIKSTDHRLHRILFISFSYFSRFLFEAQD